MDYWKNKVVIITGAGRGIGAQIAIDLIKNEMIVFGLEPSEDKFEEIRYKLECCGYLDKNFISRVCDISNGKDLENVFEEINSKYGGVDILFNNAVTGKADLISTGNLEVMKHTANVNIFGMMACTRLAIESMNKKESGFIINVNSICGHYMPNFAEPLLNLYVVSKKTMTTLNSLIRKELKLQNNKIRVISISPGVVRTNIFEDAGLHFVNDTFFDQNPHMTPEDVSNIVLKILSAPRNVIIKEIIFHALHDIY